MQLPDRGRNLSDRAPSPTMLTRELDLRMGTYKGIYINKSEIDNEMCGQTAYSERTRGSIDLE